VKILSLPAGATPDVVRLVEKFLAVRTARRWRCGW
jgi:hypothetical protein